MLDALMSLWMIPSLWRWVRAIIWIVIVRMEDGCKGGRTISAM